MRRAIAVILAVMGVFSTAGMVGAAIYSSSAEIPFTKTNWSNLDLALDQFNPAWGTLNSVTLKLDAKVWGYEVGVENLGDQADTFKLNLWATTKVKKGTTILVTANPSDSKFTEELTAHQDDGTWWGPTSGAIYTNYLLGTDSVSTVITDWTDFIGIGTITLKGDSTAGSLTEGSGNSASYYKTKSYAKAEVIYNFTPIPEAGSIATLGAGLLGLSGWFTRRRK